MTDTNTLAPTNAEILEMAEDFRLQSMHGGITFDEFDEIGFARAFLAKWGAPASASSEPVERQLLTDEQIEALPVWSQFVGLWPENRKEIARAIEAAHGIAAQQGDKNMTNNCRSGIQNAWDAWFM